MPTASEQARAEAKTWRQIAGHWTQRRAGEAWADRPPSEQAVIVFFDPSDDLGRRARDFDYELIRTDLSALARFAARLTDIEANAWDREIPDQATRAYEARRFLLGDRILHWAVPWLDAIGRSYPSLRESAHSDRDLLLDFGDEGRIATQLPGREGLQVEGEDSYGPIKPEADLEQWLNSLWSGLVKLRVGPGGFSTAPYETARERWLDLADGRPGSAQLWLDLAARAERTIELLE